MELIKEGLAKVYKYSGKVEKSLPVFYNPEMALQRDITVAALQVFQKSIGREMFVCDPLAGSGIRGIRILKEVKRIKKVVFNDVTSDSIKLIRKNLKLNRLSKAKVSKKDARILLFENMSEHDFVDIDPFGSPAKYLEASAFSLRHGSLFAATATDTGALAGSFPKTCLRRYGVSVCKTDFYTELGIRVLITAIQRAFARYKSSFIPLLCHSAHYFRVIGSVEKNLKSADSALRQIGFVSYCPKCLHRSFDVEKTCPNCKSKTNLIGPIWLGQIQDNKFSKQTVFEGIRRGFKLKFSEEVNVPFYYDLSEICSRHKFTMPKPDLVVERLMVSGFQASRSNLCPAGIKTDAGIKELVKIISS